MLVRYYGPVGIASGYGHAANETCMAILASGLDLEIQTYNPSPGSGLENRLHKRYLPLEMCIRHDGVPPTPNPDVVIVHTLPRDCAKVLEVAKIRELYPKAICIAYTTWEAAPPIPDDIAHGLEAFDQVWVPSEQTREAMAHGTSRYLVRVVPHAFDDRVTRRSEVVESVFGPRVYPPFRFYYIGAWTRRKNPEGVIQAFLRAFSHNDVGLVELVIQSAGASPVTYALTVAAAVGASHHEPSIRFSNRWLSDDEVFALHHSMHCFVTASRGEAWNLPAFDAMMAGRHIISPADLGSQDFLRQTSAWLYDSRLVPAGGEAYLDTRDGKTSVRVVGADLTARETWWEPDIDRLSALMRRAVDEYVTALTVFYDPAERYGRRVVGGLIRRLLERANHQ